MMVKAITYPLNYKVYASQSEMQLLQPEIDRIKEQYKDNEDLIQMRTTMLFEKAEVNPLAGCLPTLLQFPIFIGLYRTLLNLGKDRALEEPFLFIPSLEGPVVAGLPTDYVGVREDAPWLFQNWVDGHPPLGWHDTAIYCILPVLVVLSQIASAAIIKKMAPAGEKPKEVKGDGSAETLVAVLPYLIGWFSLNLPAGCALYWLVNNIATTAQQVYIKQQFLPELEAAYAASGAAGGSTIVTEAEKKAAEVVQEEGWLRGAKAAYKKFDDFLGAGLPEAPAEEVPEEKTSVNVFDKEFWIKDKDGPQLKPEEIDDVKAKFKAAREARKAAKAASAVEGAVGGAGEGAVEVVASGKDSE
jgi:YidC/Oxa1 family membrane protein insertase